MASPAEKQLRAMHAMVREWRRLLGVIEEYTPDNEETIPEYESTLEILKELMDDFLGDS